MFLAEIGTAGVISAYFFRHMTSGYSLNVSDPIEGRPVQLSYYLCVFGCGLVFWLLVLLRAKLHGSGDRQADIRKVAKLAKLIAPITTLNLCGCLLAPFKKLPLLVRFLVLLQVSSNLALLLIWAFLSLKKCMIVPDAHTQQQQKSSLELQAVRQKILFHIQCPGISQIPEAIKFPADAFKQIAGGKAPADAGKKRAAGEVPADVGKPAGKVPGGGEVAGPPTSKLTKIVTDWYKRSVAVYNIDSVGGKVDKAGASGSGHGSGASRSGGGSEGGESGSDSVGGGDRGASGSEHGSGASGSGGGNEGGDRGRDGGGADLECGGRGTNTEQAFKSSKITEMSLMLTAQTTAALIGFHLTTPSKALLVVVLIDQLVAYLCGLTSILLSSNKPEDSKAAKIFADIGFVCTALGFILMVAMFVPRYLVLISVLLFGVVWLIFFRNGLKTRATEVWHYLKNARNL